MAGGTRHDKQMPDEVTVAQARVGREESHARRVSHAARDQPDRPDAGTRAYSGLTAITMSHPMSR